MPDPVFPTAPSNLTASAVSSSQINLSWFASNDNIGIAKYHIERCLGNACANFSGIADTTSLSYSDFGLVYSSLYTYRVRSADFGGNLSPYSNLSSATTSDPPDLVPVTLTVSISGSTVTIKDSLKNQDAGAAGAFNVGFFLSTDTAYQMSDTSLVD